MGREPLNITLDLLEENLGYRFTDRFRLVEALTHRSYANEAATASAIDNERLEFLGDAVLSLVVSACLLRHFPDAAEGSLTHHRADLVNATSLAALGRSLHLGDYLRLGRGEERSGGSDKDNLLADALEAVLGAIFLDGGYHSAAAVVERLFGAALHVSIGAGEADAKTRLQEFLQARQQTRPAYRLVAASGPDHQRSYEVEVLVNGRVLGTGTGGSKKRAEQIAAGEALRNLEQTADE